MMLTESENIEIFFALKRGSLWLHRGYKLFPQVFLPNDPGLEVSVRSRRDRQRFRSSIFQRTASSSKRPTSRAEQLLSEKQRESNGRNQNICIRKTFRSIPPENRPQRPQERDGERSWTELSAKRKGEAFSDKGWMAARLPFFIRIYSHSDGKGNWFIIYLNFLILKKLPLITISSKKISDYLSLVMLHTVIIYNAVRG